MTRLSVGALLELAAWWVLLGALGICFVSTVNAAETGVMLFAAAVGAVACVVARRAQRVRFGPATGTARPVLRATASVLPDAVRLVSAVLRHPRRPEGVGHLRAVEFGRTGDDAVELTRRAVLTAVLSATPGSYVTGLSPEGIAYVHEIGGDAGTVIGGDQEKGAP